MSMTLVRYAYGLPHQILPGVLLMRTTIKTAASTLVATVAGLGLSYSAATAQSLTATESCLRGEVDAYEYAELMQNFRESTWDNRAGIKLLADYAEVTLKVLDLEGRSVCENVADLTTQCAFKLRYGDDFTIIVDNSMRSSSTGYRICAY